MRCLASAAVVLLAVTAILAEETPPPAAPPAATPSTSATSSASSTSATRERTAPDAIQEETHACQNPSGEIVFQNDPCDAVPPKKKAAAPKPESKPESRTTKKAAASAKKSAVPVSTPPPVAPASVVPPVARSGKSSFVATPIRPVIDPSVFTADPLWGSPERTLKTFVGALKGGDRALARACLAAGTSDDLDRMRASVDAFSGYVLEGQVGPYWSIRALRPRIRPKWIFFTRANDGTWRIAAL